MAQVTLKALAKMMDLDPKVIRRLIRKKLPDLKGDYTWAEGNPAYVRVLKVCEDYKTQAAQPKPPKQAKKERKYEKVEWDQQGTCIVDGSVFALASVPQPDNPTTLDVQTIYLGPVDEVMSILEGKKPIPNNIHHLKELAFMGILKKIAEDRAKK